MFFNKFIDFLVARSKKEYSVAIRTVAAIAGATGVLVLIPAIVYGIGCLLNKTLLPHNLSIVLSIVCFVIGIPWVLSAVFWQLFVGKGTPVPLVPTKEFLKNGPYKYVRNPMMLGYFLYLFGWTFLFNNIGAIITAAVLIIFFTSELKLVEEPELEKRFGDAYREYKKEMPFLLPRWKK